MLKLSHSYRMRGQEVAVRSDGARVLWVEVSALPASWVRWDAALHVGGEVAHFCGPRGLGALGVSRLKGELKSAQLSLAGCFPFLDSAVLAVRS